MWEHSYVAHYPAGALCENAHGGPVAAPIVRDGRLYTVGWTGAVHCLEARTGAVRWHKDVGNRRQEFEGAASPVLEGNLLIVCFGWKGAGAGTVVALDKDSGAEMWRALVETATNSSPIVITAGGVRQLIVGRANQIASLDPATGTVHWRERVSPAELSRLKVFLNKSKDSLTKSEMAEKTILKGKWDRERIWLGAPFDVWIDWWNDDLTGGSRLKTWAGKQLVWEILDALQRSFRTRQWTVKTSAEYLFERFSDGNLPLYFDADIAHIPRLSTSALALMH